MKNLKFLLILLMTISPLLSCVDDDNDELTADAAVGGLLSINSPLISFVVGNEGDFTYTANGSVFQGTFQTTSVDVYKSFTDAVTGSTSNEVLLETITVANQNVGETVDFISSFSYDTLKEGLLIDGAALPDDDSTLNIGDFWTLRYAANTSAGGTSFNAANTKVAVGTRYAGVYNTLESSYYNGAFGGLQGGNYNGTERIIESVNATVYRHVGLAYWDANEFFFTVDNTTNYITILPEDLNGEPLLLNGSPAMTCEGAGGPFEWIVCDETTSVAIPDDVDGKDQLLITTGYFRGTGATREFFERLEKVVE